MADNVNQEIGERSYRDLLVPGTLAYSRNRTLASGSNVEDKQVLAKDGDGKMIPYNSAEDAPQNVAYAIAAESRDASEGERAITVYVAGAFREEALVFANTDDSADDVFDDLRERSIILQPR